MLSAMECIWRIRFIFAWNSWVFRLLLRKLKQCAIVRIDKSYTNNYTDKYIELVLSKSTTTSMRENGLDKYAKAQVTMFT